MGCVLSIYKRIQRPTMYNSLDYLLCPSARVHALGSIDFGYANAELSTTPAYLEGEFDAEVKCEQA